MGPLQRETLHRFYLAKKALPLLNTPDFKTVFGDGRIASLVFDDQQLLIHPLTQKRPLETIALPGTKFEVIKSFNDRIVHVKTLDYPAESLYTDVRFLEQAVENAPERLPHMPPRQMILKTLSCQEGASYVWGGNWPGIEQMLTFYPPSCPLSQIDPLTYHNWTMNGFDCSGLLYYATNGATPRNTSDLIQDRFGINLPIQGKTPQEILPLLQELDAIVWKGHVVLVFDKKTAIESRAKKGVVKTPLETRLHEIIHEMGKAPANSWDSAENKQACFVIKRWHPDALKRKRSS